MSSSRYAMNKGRYPADTRMLAVSAAESFASNSAMGVPRSIRSKVLGSSPSTLTLQYKHTAGHAWRTHGRHREMGWLGTLLLTANLTVRVEPRPGFRGHGPRKGK